MTVWMRRPAAWLPFAVALASLAFVVGYAAAFGVAAHTAEHGPARVFQMLLLLQGALIALFALRWLARAPRQAAAILLGQLLAMAVPVVAVLVLEGGA